MGIVIVGRGVSLENAGEGVKLYFATWRGGQLSSPGVWQAACGQVNLPRHNYSFHSDFS
jgi:solute carrier family 6 GABA transporter-like protein 1